MTKLQRQMKINGKRRGIINLRVIQFNTYEEHILISLHPFSKGYTHVIFKYDLVYGSIHSML